MTDRTLSKEDMMQLFEQLSERLCRKNTFAKLHVVKGHLHRARVPSASERPRTSTCGWTRATTPSRRRFVKSRKRRGCHAPGSTIRQEPSSRNRTNPRGPTLYESQSLVVTGASGELLLAMKLEASGDKDTEDIKVLLKHLGIKSSDAALEQHRKLFPNSRKTPNARAMLTSISENHEGLAPPTPIEELRTQWRATLAANTFPHYEFEQTEDGLFTLTVQHAEEAPRKVVGMKLTLHALALKERTHRGWPVEAAEEISQFTEAEIARRKEISR